MKYITGRYALNLPCSLGTPGDWHYYALDWEHPQVKESATAFFGNFGLESHQDVPGHAGTLWVANHLRALLDLLADGAIPIARGMKDNYLNAPKLNQIAFSKVWELRHLGHWNAIDDFMLREYGLEWVHWKGEGDHLMTDQAIQFTPWTHGEQVLHRQVMEEVLRFLFKEEDCFVLKGGTALVMCYQMDRFSEDIDLDTEKRDILKLMRRFCQLKGWQCVEDKDTATVKRCHIHYNGDKHPLKVEVSYRDQSIDREFDTVVIPVNRIPVRVYNIDCLAQKKVNAYRGRDAVRDLHDLCFICQNYLRHLSAPTINNIVEAFQIKGADYVEALIENNRLQDSTRQDPLIDCNKLIDDYLKTEELVKQRRLELREARRQQMASRTM